MPYISHVDALAVRRTMDPTGPGELNYLISRIIARYLGPEGSYRYADVNEVMGVLECCKMELVARILQPYEMAKRLDQRNADPYFEDEHE